jgi:hypothetical protein
MDRVEQFARPRPRERRPPDAPPLGVTAARVRRAAARAADDLQPVFRAFGAATGCAAALWDASDAPWRRLVSTARPAAPDDPAAFAEAAGAALRDGTPHPPPDDARGRAAVRVAAVPGAPDTWLVVGPCAEPAGDPEADAARLDAQLGLLLPLVAGRVRAATEVEQAAQELTERYEEINLLYTISEILGRTVTLEETAATILTEVSETVGARRAAIFVHDRVTDTLVAVAALGAEADALPPVRADDPASLPARVFRTLHPVIDESPGPPPAAEAPVRDGPTLAGADPLDRAGRRRAVRRRGALRARPRPAVHRRRPQARLRDRVADRRRHPERAPRPRVAAAAAPRAGDGARPRPADGAPAARRRRRARRAGGRPRGPRRERRRRLLPPVPPAGGRTG